MLLAAKKTGQGYNYVGWALGRLGEVGYGGMAVSPLHSYIAQFSFVALRGDSGHESQGLVQVRPG